MGKNQCGLFASELVEIIRPVPRAKLQHSLQIELILGETFTTMGNASRKKNAEEKRTHVFRDWPNFDLEIKKFVIFQKIAN